MFLSVPGLRPRDLADPALTPNLCAMAARGARAEIVPTFPCVTSTVQASMFTGAPPAAHGIIGNGFFHRDRRAVELWVGANDLIQRPQLFQILRERSNGRLTSAVWHAQNIKGAAADYIITPAPIHEPDGSTRLWCYSKPDGLYAQLLADIGHFPLQHYWGPLAGLPSSRWIVDAAVWLARRHAPNLHVVYIPHLDYAAQKFGPDSPQAHQALAEFDALLGDFVARIAESSAGADVEWLLASEYTITPVSGAVFPNRLLRQAGLLAVRDDGAGAELLDFDRSRAFAVVDHQFAHIYVQGADPAAVAEVFAGAPGVALAAHGRARRDLGLDHPRSGEVILLSDPDQWFAYYWWLNDAQAPAFARTVDIHLKPGYDPVELFFDPATRSIPLDASLVRGSHGLPADSPRLHGAVISSSPGLFDDMNGLLQDTDLAALLLSRLT